MQLLQTNIKNFSRRMANAAIIAACMAGMMIYMTSCGKKHASAEELVLAENMGRQRAMELKHNVFIDTMFVERTLIDVREREQRLRNEGADDLADRYIKGFINCLDSVNPGIAAQIK